MSLKLIAPDHHETPIIGIRLQDGTISEFECLCDKTTQLPTFKLPENIKASPLRRDGDDVLVDSVGQKWRAMDVIFYSITGFK